jgi:T5SS/PEP-CTERM-associated repeat protein
MNSRCTFYRRKNYFLACSVSIAVLSCVAAVVPARADGHISSAGSVAPKPNNDSWTWANTAMIANGAGTTGEVDMSGGATAGGDSLQIGNGDGATGKLQIDGNNSHLSTTGTLSVGNDGASVGTLSITGGARVDANSRNTAVSIGHEKKSTGHVFVDGSGSTLASNAAITIAYQGKGDLTIANGGHVSGTKLKLADQPSATGVVTISGTGSSWSGTDGVFVGVKGSGELNLFDGGAINDRSLQIAYHPGASGTVNIGGGQNDAAKAGGVVNVDVIQFNGLGGGSNGVLNFNTTDGVAINAAIFGVGTINQIAGTTILNGDTGGFSGDINVSGGQLQYGSGGTGTSQSYNINDNSQVSFDYANSVVFSGRFPAPVK